jgi:predicted ATP-grasp superfamily ATP-dependent carboligase
MVRTPQAETPYEVVRAAFDKYQGQLAEKPDLYKFAAGYIAALHRTALDVKATEAVNGLDFRPNSIESRMMANFRETLIAVAERVAKTIDTAPQPTEPEEPE